MTDVVTTCIRLLRAILIALISIILLMIAGKVHAEDHGHHGVGHNKLHHWYKSLMRPDFPSSSCCSNEDCRATQARWVNDHWEAQKDGRWISIPAYKINKEESLDSQAHICAPKASTNYPADYIFCFVKPGTGI